jgi:type II secretory pathway pseudopilin PulG
MSKKSFTLIEILVVIAIIIILTSLSFFSFGTAKKNLALERAIHKLAQDLKWAQKMSLGAEKVTPAQVVPPGYGIYFDISTPDRYIIFADCIPPGATTSDNKYTTSTPTCCNQEVCYPELLEEIVFEKGVKLNRLYIPPPWNLTPPTLNILFRRSPTFVSIRPGNEAEITLTTEDETITSTIYVNAVGLIYIKD